MISDFAESTSVTETGGISPDTHFSDICQKKKIIIITYCTFNLFLWGLTAGKLDQSYILKSTKIYFLNKEKYFLFVMINYVFFFSNDWMTVYYL